MFVNTVAYEDSIHTILPFEMRRVAQHERIHEMIDDTASREDQNASIGLKRITDDGDSSGSKGCWIIGRAG
jgi:hypothetical protein